MSNPTIYKAEIMALWRSQGLALDEIRIRISSRSSSITSRSRRTNTRKIDRSGNCCTNYKQVLRADDGSSWILLPRPST